MLLCSALLCSIDVCILCRRDGGNNPQLHIDGACKCYVHICTHTGECKCMTEIKFLIFVKEGMTGLDKNLIPRNRLIFEEK